MLSTISGFFRGKVDFEAREKARLKQFQDKYGLSSDDLEQLPIYLRNGTIYYWHDKSKKMYGCCFNKWKVIGYDEADKFNEQYKLELDIEYYTTEENDEDALKEAPKDGVAVIPEEVSKDKKPKKPKKKHNLSDMEIELFEEIFKVSAEPLEKINQRYRDASTHYWHPEKKWIYSLCVSKWKSNSYNYLSSIAQKAGFTLDKSSEVSVDPKMIDVLYQSKCETMCDKNSSKTECSGNTIKQIYYYKVDSRPTQQFCTYCKENCIRITAKEKWSDRMLSSGNFDCTCGDCNCVW